MLAGAHLDETACEVSGRLFQKNMSAEGSFFTSIKFGRQRKMHHLPCGMGPRPSGTTHDSGTGHVFIVPSSEGYTRPSSPLGLVFNCTIGAFLLMLLYFPRILIWHEQRQSNKRIFSLITAKRFTESVIPPNLRNNGCYETTVLLADDLTPHAHRRRVQIPFSRKLWGIVIVAFSVSSLFHPAYGGLHQLSLSSLFRMHCSINL